MTKQQQLEALEQAYAQGVQQVQHNGQTITYRSRKEMAAIISQLKSELGGTRRKARYVSDDRGYR